MNGGRFILRPDFDSMLQGGLANFNYKEREIKEFTRNCLANFRNITPGKDFDKQTGSIYLDAAILMLFQYTEVNLKTYAYGVGNYLWNLERTVFQKSKASQSLDGLRKNIDFSGFLCNFKKYIINTDLNPECLNDTQGAKDFSDLENFALLRNTVAHYCSRRTEAKCFNQTNLQFNDESCALLNPAFMCKPNRKCKRYKISQFQPKYKTEGKLLLTPDLIRYIEEIVLRFVRRFFEWVYALASKIPAMANVYNLDKVRSALEGE